MLLKKTSRVLSCRSLRSRPRFPRIIFGFTTREAYGQYSGWTVYAFEQTTEDTGNYNGGPVAVTGTDSYGAYFDVGVTSGATSVGVIIAQPYPHMRR